MKAKYIGTITCIVILTIILFKVFLNYEVVEYLNGTSDIRFVVFDTQNMILDMNNKESELREDITFFIIISIGVLFVLRLIGVVITYFDKDTAGDANLVSITVTMIVDIIILYSIFLINPLSTFQIVLFGFTLLYIGKTIIEANLYANDKGIFNVYNTVYDYYVKDNRYTESIKRLNKQLKKQIS